MTAETLRLLDIAGTVALTFGMIHGLAIAYARQVEESARIRLVARTALLAGGVFTTLVLMIRTGELFERTGLGAAGLAAFAVFLVALIELARCLPALRLRVGVTILLLTAGTLILKLIGNLGADAGPLAG